MLLEDKNAVIYGGGGSIGGAVGRAFAREGARGFLAGRTLTRLEKVAEEVRSTGGIAETARVDALDEKAVDEHADAVAASAGGIDISFNLISHGDAHGTPMADTDLEAYARPVVTAVRTGGHGKALGTSPLFQGVCSRARIARRTASFEPWKPGTRGAARLLAARAFRKPSRDLRDTCPPAGPRSSSNVYSLLR